MNKGVSKTTSGRKKQFDEIIAPKVSRFQTGGNLKYNQHLDHGHNGEV